MRIDTFHLRALMTLALENAEHDYETDRDAGAPSTDFAAGRVDGLEQAVEILDRLEAEEMQP
jgi:hypothetical protein